MSNGAGQDRHKFNHKKFNSIFILIFRHFFTIKNPKICPSFYSYIYQFFTIFNLTFIFIFPHFLPFFFLTKNSSFMLIRSQNFDSIFILIFSTFFIIFSNQKTTPCLPPPSHTPPSPTTTIGI